MPCVCVLGVLCDGYVHVKGMCVLGHDEERKKEQYHYLGPNMSAHVVQCRKNIYHSFITFRKVQGGKIT